MLTCWAVAVMQDCCTSAISYEVLDAHGKVLCRSIDCCK